MKEERREKKVDWLIDTFCLVCRIFIWMTESIDRWMAMLVDVQIHTKYFFIACDG